MQNIFRFLLVGLIFVALNVGTVAAEGRCAGALTDEDRANCMAATRLSDADMSTPEGRCAGAPTDKDRENCIAANKGMGGYRSDGPPGTPVADMSTPEERCAAAPTDEDRANCMAANKRMGKRMGDADMSTPEGRCAGAPTDEERANCMAANKRMGDHHRDGPPGKHHANGTPGMSAGEALQIENAKASMVVIEPLNARIALLENQADARDAEIARMQESASTMVATIAQLEQKLDAAKADKAYLANLRKDEVFRESSKLYDMKAERDAATAEGAQKLIEVAQLRSELKEATSLVEQQKAELAGFANPGCSKAKVCGARMDLRNGVASGQWTECVYPSMC